MVGQPQPLNSNFPIVKEDGTPTELFLRWAQERQRDIQDGIDAAQANQLIADWAAQREIIAGVGLDGGGSLSNDVTIDANTQAILDAISTTHGAVLFRGASDWQALAPGSAGQVLGTNGPGADPAWVANGGGGGGSSGTTIMPLQGFSANFNDNLAAVGSRITLPFNFTVTQIGVAFTPAVGQTFKLGIYALNGSNVITAVVYESPTVSGLAAGNQTYYDVLPSPVVLTAGVRYAIVTTRTDGTGTSGYTCLFANADVAMQGAGKVFYANLRRCQAARTAHIVGDAFTDNVNPYMSFVYGTP